MKILVLHCHAPRRDGTVCGHRWIARTETPKVCPKCKRRDWRGKLKKTK